MESFTQEDKSISTKKVEQMATPKFRQNLSNLLRARHPLFYVTLNEEKRYLEYMEHFCRAEGYQCFTWDSVRGVQNLFTGEEVADGARTKNNPVEILDYILNNSKEFEKHKPNVDREKEKGIKGHIYILLDYFRFLSNPNPDIERRLKNIANKGTIISTIMTGPYYKTTDVLENMIPTIDFPPASRQELKSALYDVVKGASRALPSLISDTEEIENELIDAVSGLTILEAQTAFSMSLVQFKDWDIPTILGEKRQAISKSGLLEFFDKPVSMSDIGGLKKLSRWIRDRRQCFTPEAEAYGLKKPRGLLSVGLPGCGKSLTSKAIASCWGMPLLRMDFGGLFNSLIGQSEANARSAIRLAEAIAPCILWIDEIEKAISGINSNGKGDSGTTARVLSIFLTWMQEKESPVFVVATANNHEAIPAEFLRAGRFDEIFFVDLPNSYEKREILEVLLRKNKLDPSNFDLDELAFSERLEGFSGAEIEKVIENAKLKGFEDGKRLITNDDIRNAASFIPLSKMRADDFDDLREWAGERCMPASDDTPEKEEKTFTKKKTNSKKSVEIDI